MTTTNTKHTAGPWTRDKRDGDWHIFAPSKEEGVCLVQETIRSEQDEAEANARLIAAAPELLKALEECVAEFAVDDAKDKEIQGHWGLNEPQSIEMARSAIAKATGKDTDPS